jgi:hypothetical protein
VFIPNLEARIKQSRRLSILRIKRSHIVAFVGIAVVASPTQIIQLISAAVFHGDDMIGVIGD